MARAYSVFATGGRELQLRPETLQALIAPAVPAESGFYDECVKGEMRYSLGFFKPGPTLPFGQPGSFVAPGAGAPSPSPIRKPGSDMHMSPTVWARH
jgi:hypothetical protein